MAVTEELKKLRVVDNTMINATSGILRFRRFFTFTAGQVVKLTTSEKIAPRMYSICSAEDDEFIEILYKIVPAGSLSPSLGKLDRRSDIFVSEAFGKFLPSTGAAYLIATGTGIAPYLSMVRSGYTHQKTLLHGSRNLEDFYYREFLEKKLSMNYIPCYTGAEQTPMYKGRVTDFLQAFPQLPPDIKYYLCGSAEMVVDTRDLLINKGVPFQHILSEIYF